NHNAKYKRLLPPYCDFANGVRSLMKPDLVEFYLGATSSGAQKAIAGPLSVGFIPASAGEQGFLCPADTSHSRERRAMSLRPMLWRGDVGTRRNTATIESLKLAGLEWAYLGPCSVQLQAEQGT